MLTEIQARNGLYEEVRLIWREMQCPFITLLRIQLGRAGTTMAKQNGKTARRQGGAHMRRGEWVSKCLSKKDYYDDDDDDDDDDGDHDHDDDDDD